MESQLGKEAKPATVDSVSNGKLRCPFSSSRSVPQEQTTMSNLRIVRETTSPSLLERSSFILFHKPKWYIVTRKDEKQRKTVYHALPPFVLQEGWVPIGRLDKDSRGLLLFTQEGTLVDLFTEPGRCEKTYEVVIRGRISDEDLSRTLFGVPTPIGTLKVDRIAKKREVGPKTQLEVVLREGKNRHLCRIFHALKDPTFHTPSRFSISNA